MISFGQKSSRSVRNIQTWQITNTVSLAMRHCFTSREDSLLSSHMMMQVLLWYHLMQFECSFIALLILYLIPVLGSACSCISTLHQSPYKPSHCYQLWIIRRIPSENSAYHSQQNWWSRCPTLSHSCITFWRVLFTPRIRHLLHYCNIFSLFHADGICK